jgi:hypothetical protein
LAAIKIKDKTRVDLFFIFCSRKLLLVRRFDSLGN